MTNRQLENLLALVAERDARDSLERAVAWVVLVRHEVHDEILTVYGSFEQPAAAFEWAADFQAGLNVEGEEGFRCDVTAVMPS